VPVSSLEPILIKLSAQQWFSAGRQGKAENAGLRRQLEAKINTAELECVVEVGSATATLSELLDLQPGDLLRLDRSANADLELKVGGEPRFYGRAGTVGSNLGFAVTATAPQTWVNPEGE
jgi:flagellar motor switch protein FliM